MLRVFNADGPRGFVLAMLLAVIALLAAGGESIEQALRLERYGVDQGQWWRAITGHFVHLDAAHALVNAAGLVLVWGLVIEEFSPRAWIGIVCASMLAIDLGLLIWVPQIDWYVGASGVLHGMLAAGILAGLVRGDRVALIAGALLLAKLIYEQWQGPLAFTEGQTVVVAAHSFGAAGGVVAALAVRGLAQLGVRRHAE